MKQYTIIFLLLMTALTPVTAKQNRLKVVKGSAESLLTTIAEANRLNGSPDALPLTISIPAGVYDLGETCLTELSGHNITIKGEGMSKTIIRNAPVIANEGISRTATLLISGTCNTLSDLTLENALDYYGSGFAGRAVALQDKGTGTRCYKVRLLSHQDTYYTCRDDGLYYWRDSEIRGTVDFICGKGTVLFDRCRIGIEKRRTDGTGSCVIAAPHNSMDPYGVVFWKCVIENNAGQWRFARAWNGESRCAVIGCTLLDTARLAPTRFETKGMNVVATSFVECRSRDIKGKVISPASNILTFRKDSIKVTRETILPSDSMRLFSPRKVFSTLASQGRSCEARKGK